MPGWSIPTLWPVPLEGFVTVATRTLPAGSCSISAKLEAENRDSANDASLSCVLHYPGNTSSCIDASFVVMPRSGQFGNSSGRGQAIFQADLSNFSGGAIMISCAQSGTHSSSASVALVHVTALKVDSVQY